MANIASEKVFLAGIVKHPDKLFEFVEYLDEDDFQHSVTRMTFEALASLIVAKETKKITKSKLVAEARALGHQNYLSATNNGEWIDELIAEEITKDEIGNYFLEVKRQSLKKQYTEAFIDMRDYLSATDDPLSTMISKVENAIVSKVNIIDKGEHAIEDMREGFKEFINSIADDPGHMGLDLGYPLWQERIGHVKNGSVTFVVGTTGSGKSQFAMRTAITAARKGLPVLYLDSELSKKDQWVRMAAMIARIPSEYIEAGVWRMSEKELIDHGIDDAQIRQEIMAHGRKLKEPRLWEAVDKMPIFHQSISGLSVPEVLPHVRRWLLTHVKPDRETQVPQCLIVYDYIKLTMTNNIQKGVVQEYQQNGIHMSDLHDFVKKYNVPVIGFGQTNNELIAGIKAVAGGKRISENVDSVSYFKRKTNAERGNDGSGTHMMEVFKARFGKGLWGSYINFDTDLSCGHFEELEIGNVQQNNNNNDDDDDDE